MPANPALILFLKNPIPGKTKTRLAATVGDDMALRMYDILVRWTHDQLIGLPRRITCYLYYSESVMDQDVFEDDRFVKRTQRGADLGERMEKAFAEVFAMAHDAAIIIGSDCPGVTTKYLEDAFVELESKDVVIGPALDGGYTLLGMQSTNPNLFRAMNWSTEAVLATTIERCEQAGKSFQLLHPLSDIDHIEDWYGYGWTLPTQ